MKEFHFLNLTNGLEWYDEVPNPQLIRIESTAIEKNDIWRILRDLDANFLMNIAIGNRCTVYDCGTRRENSKTITVGIPLIQDYLFRIWSGYHPPLLTDSERESYRKIKYFRRYFNGNILLRGFSRSTTHDGDVDFYRELMGKFNEKIQCDN